jgi:hypothetical protein
MDVDPAALEPYKDIEPLVDLETGYAINLPLGLQMSSTEAVQRPEVVARIVDLRIHNGVTVADDLFEPEDSPDDLEDAFASLEA